MVNLSETEGKKTKEETVNDGTTFIDKAENTRPLRPRQGSSSKKLLAILKQLEATKDNAIEEGHGDTL